jgi:DNA-directed RNA polymerase specialized sigma24 family protein
MSRQDNEDARLSRMATRWTMLQEAHDGPPGAAAEARKLLLMHYHRAAYRYLLGAVRDPDAAEEILQELSLRYHRGDFRRADPGRGRFRDYLKAVLVNLVNGYHTGRREQPRPLPADAIGPAAPDAGPDTDFLSGWRSELIDRALEALARAHPKQHLVLRARLEDPAATSAELAERLAAQLGQPVRADQVRKALQRAHEGFAAMLLEEVARSLGPDPDVTLEQELRELDLLKYCRSALERRRGG